MAEFQHRHWCRMIEAVDAYLEGKLDLGVLVGTLESSLIASELKDKDLKEEFMQTWEPFEFSFSKLQVMGTPVDLELMNIAAKRMRAFLVRTIDDVNAYDPGDW